MGKTNYNLFCYKKSASGITLIALVITIIVMLILAGVTIRLTVGEEGILSRAERAADETKRASIKETVDLWKFDKAADERLETNDALSYEQFVYSLLEQELIDNEEKEEILETGRLKVGDEYIDFLPLDTKVFYCTETTDGVKEEYAMISVAFEKCSEFLYVIEKLEGISAEEKVEYLVDFVNEQNPSAETPMTKESLYTSTSVSSAEELLQKIKESTGMPAEAVFVFDGIVTGEDVGFIRKDTTGTIVLPDGSSVTTEDSEDPFKQGVFHKVTTNGTYVFTATTSEGEEYRIAIDVTELPD